MADASGPKKNIVDSYVTKCWNTLDTIVKLEVEPAEGLADFIQDRLKGSACQAIRDKAKTDEAPSNSSSYAMLIYDMKSAGEASSHPSTRLPPLRQNGEHLKDFIRGSLAANVGHKKDDLADADLWVIPDGMKAGGQASNVRRARRAQLVGRIHLNNEKNCSVTSASIRGSSCRFRLCLAILSRTSAICVQGLPSKGWPSVFSAWTTCF